MAVKLRAAGYARVSVAHEESTSIDQQIDAIAEKCKREGWLFDPKKDLYIDEGLSGSKKNVKRPQFEKMISSASKYDRIVVFRFDRLSRRMSELATTIETLNELHVAVVSINEGFGLPLLEAFQYELPALIANNTCLPEVAGHAALSFNPYEVNDMVSKMKQLIDSPSLQKEMIALGLERLTYFSWEKTSSLLLSVFKEAVKEKV